MYDIKIIKKALKLLKQYDYSFMSFVIVLLFLLYLITE